MAACNQAAARPSARKGVGGPEALKRAHRALIHLIVIAKDAQPDEFRLVRQQYPALKRWHDEHTGWPIYLGERAIRLVRRPAIAPAGGWEPWRTVRLGSQRGYACLTWILWYARSPMVMSRGIHRQFLLSDLAGHITERSLAVGGGALAFDFAHSRDDRRSLVSAFRILQDLGAIHVYDGAAEDWVREEDLLCQGYIRVHK